MSGTESGEEMEVAEILGERKNNKGHWFLVRWAGYGDAEDTWEKEKNLTNAKGLIQKFYDKMAKTKQQKKPRKKSTSRSRSRSRSQSRGRSGSKSPARTRKSSSRGRKSETKSTRSRKSETTKTVSSTPNVEETKTETVTQSPGRYERTTETIQKSLFTPSQTRQSTYVTRTTEVKTSSQKSSRDLPDGPAAAGGWRGWMQGCCQQVRNSQRGLADMVRSDYTALVVFGVISIIMLSFVLEKNVDLPKVWASIVTFFGGIWAWLTKLVPTK